MHVLLTTDAVGGVWTYTEELSAGLIARGHQVTLVTLGSRLDAGQREWVAAMHSSRFRIVETEYRLEWMEDASADLLRSAELLRDLVRDLQPDVLHTNQYAYGELSELIPVLMTGHSDVLSWWEAVNGESAPDTGRIRAYAALVRGGLQAATKLAAPTAWMAREMREQYGIDRIVEVVPNGRSPELFSPGGEKKLQVITVGRAWDPGKHVALLERVDLAVPRIVAGEASSPVPGLHEGEPAMERERHGVTYLGKQTSSELRTLYSETAIYVATSCYEPFGLAPLEAALSGCALVLSDLPTLREIWEDTALYYRVNDANSLQSQLEYLTADPERTRDLGARALARARSRYTADAMVVRHEALYSSLVQVPTA